MPSTKSGGIFRPNTADRSIPNRTEAPPRKIKTDHREEIERRVSLDLVFIGRNDLHGPCTTKEARVQTVNLHYDAKPCRLHWRDAPKHHRTNDRRLRDC